MALILDMSIKIIPFKQAYAARFRDLSVVWLEKFFYVEPHDVMLLDNCQESIIEKGGYIFFAEHDKALVGCFALVQLRDKVFELGKMAVDPKFQGLKIGQQLLVFAIDMAKKNDWDKIIIYSSTKLDAALYIYRKYGFREVELEKENPYQRSDIKMELVFKQ